MERKNLHVLLYSLAAALLVTLITGAGILRRVDKWTQDLLFQRPGVASPDIVIIGIDEKALAEIGPYNTWDRNVMASALEALASDPDKRPAVTAIAALYSGETESGADERLAKAAEKLGSVVTAAAAEFGYKVLWKESGNAVIDDYAVLGVEFPYESLRNVTTQGHINSVYDADGVMRHAILFFDGEECGRVDSMAYSAARLFLAKSGRKVKIPYVNSLGQFYVPFSTAPGGFYEGVSIADLIRGDVSPDYYAGKIVLIGPWASGLQDAYFTPTDITQQMYGVEFQANVIQCLLESDYKREIPDLPQLLVLFVICTAAAFLFQKKKVGFSGIICVAAVILGVALSMALYSAGFLTYPTWIPICVIIIYLMSVGDHYVRAAIARQNITRTFERYVAPEIVGEILKEGTDNLSLGGKLCNIAVLFVDLRGFTSMSARLDPEKVVFILNRYLAMASECIERNRGTLDKFIGDATMAFWGAPLPQEDPVYLASKTALEIARGAKRVSAKLKEEIGEEIRAGIGVHFGPAVVGNMGSERHMDYTAIGDTVNTASRLESNAPGDTVYISRVVADMLGDRAKFTSLGGSVKLKGKEEGFEVLVLEELEGCEDDIAPESNGQ